MADVVHGGSAGSTHLLGDNSAAPVSWVRDSIIPLLSWKMDSSCSYRIRQNDVISDMCASVDPNHETISSHGSSYFLEVWSYTVREHKRAPDGSVHHIGEGRKSRPSRAFILHSVTPCGSGIPVAAKAGVQPLQLRAVL